MFHFYLYIFICIFFLCLYSILICFILNLGNYVAWYAHIIFLAFKNIVIFNIFRNWFVLGRLIATEHVLIFYIRMQLKKNFKLLKFFDFFLIVPFLVWKKKNYFSPIRWMYRLKNTTWNFYNIKNSNKLFFFLNNYSYGLKSTWAWLTFWLISIVCFVCIIYYLSYLKALMFNKIIFIWFLVIMFLYWLVSGFVFFFKKYQFSKFTSVIQRFWKRSYIIFWCIESGVFLIFFYLTLNASEEPLYAYDQMKLYKEHLFSWRMFILKLIPLLTLIALGYYLKNLLKWNVFNKQVIFVLIITLILLYIVWLEFYQFYHIINYYNTYNWKFVEKNSSWLLDKELKRTRIANNYVTICLLAKFWHLIFIFIFWVFFLLRINETTRIRYFLLSANLQNFIILYIMTWLYMYPWFKYIFRPFLDYPYYWFLVNARKSGFRIFFNDIKIFFYALLNLEISNLGFFSTLPFYYIIESSQQTGFLQFKKHFLKDYIQLFII